MNLRKLGLAGAVLATIALPVFAAIHNKIGSASHQLEEHSAAMHTYTHDNYSGSMGSHGMEVSADELHTGAHDWQHGSVSDQELVDLVSAARDRFDDMTQQMNDAGVLSGPGQDKELKKIYSKIHKYMVLCEAYTASAK